MIVTEVLKYITILHKLFDTFTHGAGYCVNNLKDTDDYELYDPRIHSTLRGKIEGNANVNQAYDRGPILVNRPLKGTKAKQEVCIINCIFKLGTFFTLSRVNIRAKKYSENFNKKSLIIEQQFVFVPWIALIFFYDSYIFFNDMHD